MLRVSVVRATSLRDLLNGQTLAAARVQAYEQHLKKPPIRGHAGEVPAAA